MRTALLGDMAFFGSYSLTQNSQLKENLKEVSDYLGGFDYVVGNLETPFSHLKKTSGAKSAYICADKENVELLKLLHVNAVTLANNHMFDFGNEGYELTKNLLKEVSIEWFGAEGKNLQVGKAGGRVAFSGYCCYSSNPLMCVKNGEYGVDAYNLKEAEAFIDGCEAKRYLPVLAIHAGLEHVNYPSLDHVRAARLLSKKGKFVYYGHHPHVVQGIEEHSGSLIAHSLGNFCFDDVYTNTSKTTPLVKLTENNRSGMILELTVEGNQLVDWRVQAIHIGENGKISLIDAEPLFKKYNEALVSCENNVEEYSARRNAILKSRISERKAKRDLNWYLKRLRPRYFRLVLDMRRNQNLYNENVKQFL